MSFKASRNKATKCGQQQQWQWQQQGDGGQGAARVSSAIVQSADNGRATLWDSVLVSLYISVLCVAVCVCIFHFFLIFFYFLVFVRFFILPSFRFALCYTLTGDYESET